MNEMKEEYYINRMIDLRKDIIEEIKLLNDLYHDDYLHFSDSLSRHEYVKRLLDILDRQPPSDATLVSIQNTTE